jgi:ABC-type antimicrobial peptide transport system permease subunit
VRGVASAEGLVTAARLLRSGAARRGVRHRQHVFILTTQRTREYALLRVVGASRGLIAVLGGTLLTAAEYRSARAADLGDISHVLALFTALVVLTEIIAVLGMANALALSVTERTREFAVMRALARREP